MKVFKVYPSNMKTWQIYVYFDDAYMFLEFNKENNSLAGASFQPHLDDGAGWQLNRLEKEEKDIGYIPEEYQKMFIVLLMNGTWGALSDMWSHS
jgi:hypothetical protein